MDGKLLLRPAEVAEAIGIGRSKIYKLLATGELPSIRIGGSVRVPVQKLRDWVNKKAAAHSEVGEADTKRRGRARR